jgi:hypothetical protein
MAWGVKDSKNRHLTRPRKTEAEKRRRAKVWKKKLVAMGADPAKLDRMPHYQIRAAFKAAPQAAAKKARQAAKAAQPAKA